MNMYVCIGDYRTYKLFITGFLEELSSVQQHSVAEIPAGLNRNPPVLVHCNTGIGRTAVTILSDLLLFTLDHNQV